MMEGKEVKKKGEGGSLQELTSLELPTQGVSKLMRTRPPERLV